MDSTITNAISRVTPALLSVNMVSLKLAFDGSGLPASRFAEQVLVPVLDSIGERWQKGEISLAQIYMSGRLCERLLEEHLPVEKIQVREHALGLAVLEDFHVLGKRMVSSVLHAAGYQFKDYGPVSLDDLVEKVAADGIRILLVSTLMLSSALRVRLLKERLAGMGLEVVLIVGGAPFRFDPQLWREVGADATSATASGVVALLRTMITEAPHVRV